MLSFLQLEYEDLGKYYALSCPIHGSDKKQSMSIYKNTGIWRCWTKNCHDEHGVGFFDFIRAYFESINQRKTLQEIALLCATIIEADVNNLPEIQDFRMKSDSVHIVKNLLKQRKLLEGKVLRKTVREKLYIPAKYYLDRGYDAEILDKYDVGLCKTQGKEMFGRIVVPVYDDEYRFMIGCVGRSIHQKCPICGSYHSAKRHCPTNKIEELWATKWKNSKNFQLDSYFYNYWFSKPFIRKNKTIILVEGQGDVWKLEQAGIHCSVGVFGSKLTDGQKILLEQSGAQNIIIAPDNDEAGEIFRTKLHEKCDRLFNVHDIQLEKKDFGEMSVDEIKKLVLPILERCV